MKLINGKINSDRSITIPGSKSVSHRMLICASMSQGTSKISNILDSDDIRYTMAALSKMGAGVEKIDAGDGCVIVNGFSGKPGPCDDDIYLGNSGTSMRLLAGVAALGRTPYTLTGDHRMQERPMGDLLSALNMAGIEAYSKSGTGAPPVVIKGADARGGIISLDCSQSSQYLSAVLMMGAVLPEGLVINLPGPAVSAPYIDLTMDIMKKFGVHAERVNEKKYIVPGNQTYRAGDFIVEPDLSNASYFWAAGAVTGHMVTVTGINKDSLQGDRRLLDIFRDMGCRVEYFSKGVGVCGMDTASGSKKSLKSVEVDMSDIPDVVPTLAVVAAFAEGTTKIVNIEHLREKECDRISAVVSQLRKMGVDASEGNDWLSVTGIPDPAARNREYKGALIETFNDHRIAMAFSIAGLGIEGVEIENEGCVAKSFPNYWEKFESLVSGGDS